MLGGTQPYGLKYIDHEMVEMIPLGLLCYKVMGSNPMSELSDTLLGFRRINWTTLYTFSSILRTGKGSDDELCTTLFFRVGHTSTSLHHMCMHP
ncbi:hypothetical protein V6N11_057914 [Hibiscus sabdariffa]|uniref:Uncharacterized protein n=1 Tax=Hibiscus sabdariffa TaxID=183260 RepID=A0ABR2P4R6_9ROSI